MESQKLEKSVVVRPVRWPLILAYVAGVSLVLNVMQYADSFREYGPPRHYREWVTSDFERDRLASENADLRARLAEYEPPFCVAEPKAELAPAPVAAFDTVSPQAVYYGCLDLMSRMGPFGHGLAPAPFREYALRTCAEAAEWSARHPGAPIPMLRLFDR